MRNKYELFKIFNHNILEDILNQCSIKISHSVFQSILNKKLKTIRNHQVIKKKSVKVCIICISYDKTRFFVFLQLPKTMFQNSLGPSNS